VSRVYFFRHGQAGPRDQYDQLSEKGHLQAAALGRYLVSKDWRFDQLLVGSLQRQRETLAGARAAGAVLPAATVEPRWNEFDLDGVFAEVAPQLAAADAEFAAAWAAIGRQVEAGDKSVHRDWMPADTQVVKAWIEGRFETKCETWGAFVDRVVAAGLELAALPAEARVAVFTSATPVSIWVAASLGCRDPRQVLKMAGTAINTNLTVIDFMRGDSYLALYNCAEHLSEELLTYR